MKPNNILSTTQVARYTKGKEYVLGLDEYVGEYHFRGNEVWSEFEPSLTSKKLDIYSPYLEVRRYNLIKPENKKLRDYVEPYHMIPVPTKSNYDIGNITRYFVKNRYSDFNSIIEIDTNQVKNYGNPGGIDNVKYQLESLLWYISLNERTVDRISLLNSTNVVILNKKMSGLTDYIFNLFEFSQLGI
jgi:hypothetical protein